MAPRKKTEAKKASVKSDQPAQKKPVYPGSFLAPESMGGINAGKGFDFQTRYAACGVPRWLLEAAFHQLVHEGAGDIDLRYSRDGKSSRTFMQVKDHDVQPAELKEVIEQFIARDAASPDAFQCFTVVCQSLSATLRPIENGLARLRGINSFYDDAPNTLDATKQEVDARLREVGLGDYIDFIHEKVNIDTGHADMHHDDRAIAHFVDRLLQHPDYAEKVRAMVVPAFAETMRQIGANKGKVLARADIEKILFDAVASSIASEKKITLWLQNWTSETFDVPADYSIDWSECFDRSKRQVPTPERWNGELVPQLEALKKQLLKERKERLIRFRGKCALSSGVALGAVFPTVGGWAFEIPQPPAKDAWRSDAVATEPYAMTVEEQEGFANGTDIVLGLNIRGDGRQDVVKHIESTGNIPRSYLFVSPTAQGAQSIRGASDAVAFAQSVREAIGQSLKKYDVRKTRLFFYGPFALAVFLGQHLTSVGEIQLFEYQDPGYVPSCTLKT
jgi:SMODS-associated and fused to various effectors sensor domain/Cap4 dsDNA endonuclease